MRYVYVLTTLTVVLVAGCGTNPTHSLGFPGPAETAKFDASTEFYGCDVAFTVYYPKASDVPGRRPLVVFNTGWNQPRSTSDAYCTQIAQWGMVVINRQYPSLPGRPYADRQVEHNTVVIDWALEQNGNPDSPLYKRIDADRIGAAGYSLGASISLMAPLVEPRERACVAIDPIPQQETDLGSIVYVEDLAVPVMYIRSGVPSILGPALRLYDYTAPPCMEVTIEGASHMQFEDNVVGVNILGYLVFPGMSANDVETRALATKYMVAWFKVYLEGDAAFLDYLDGNQSQSDVDNKLVALRTSLNTP